MLIDTTPDFREQAIREHIRKIDAVLYTHGHADHILGLDDVRPLSFPRVTGGGKIPLYASAMPRRKFCAVFSATSSRRITSMAGWRKWSCTRSTGPVNLFGARFTPLVVMHGDVPIEGYRFGSAAYLTDFSELPEESRWRPAGGIRHSVSGCACGIIRTPRIRRWRIR